MDGGLRALAAAPVVAPLAACALAALTMGRPRLQAWVSAAGLAAFLAVALALVHATAAGETPRVVLGGWPAPFGIEFAVDRLGAALILVTALVGGASLLALSGDADAGPAHPLVLPLVHGLLAGVAGAFATADLFNFYVWIEVTLIASVGLLALGAGATRLDATLKYLVPNLFGTFLLLMSVALVYGVTGHLNFGALARTAPGVPPALLLPALTGLLLALLIKAGAFPLFGWLPASYHTLPAPLHALFAGLLTKVGVYAVLRLTVAVLPAPAVAREVLGWVAAATMLTGVLGAAYHWDIRRILAFHVVSQIGYILLAVALGTPEGYAAAIFFTVHNILAKANLILVGGIVRRLTGGHDLRRVGGLYATHPGLAALYLIPAMALVGVPPLSGFWAKLLVLREALAAGRYAWTAVALLVSLLTLYSMVKIWMEAFWKPHPRADRQPAAVGRLGPAYAATAALAALTLLLGLVPGPLVAYARAAAAALGGAH